MSRLITILVALLALACANVASAQTTLETFESFSAGASQITSGGVTFDIVSHNATIFDIYDSTPNLYGWSGTAKDEKFIDDSSTGPYNNILPDFSVKTDNASGFTIGSFWLYLSDHNLNNLGSGGSVTLTGKLSGATVFIATANSGFNTSTAVSNGFSKIDLTTFGGSNNASKVIDEIEIVGGGNFQYIALDALTWTKSGGYTVGTAVTPGAAYGTLSCVLTSVSAGGSTTCTATPNAGYELDNISGCGGTTSTTTSFATGTINANCTVTAAFVTALSASTAESDATCNGGNNGVAAVTASNGIAPYTYSWSPSGGTASIATNLAAGTYTVTVTDGRNIQVQKQATVNQPTALVLSPASIPGGVVGIAYSQGFSVAGGTPGYSYAVTSGAVSGLSMSGNTLSGTPSVANYYNVGVTATDANSCTSTKNYPMQVRATMGLLSVSDGTSFAAYGQTLDYAVSLNNATSATVSGINVAATLSPVLDASTATWQCLNNGSNGVVCNGASNNGTLNDTAVTIPAGQTAQWNIHATVLAAPAAGSADVNVAASYATPATDSDTLVIFRDGFGGVGGN